MNFWNFAAQFGIYSVMAVVLIGAVGVVALRNLFHAALALGVVLVGVAGLYLTLHADFLAAAQVLIYVGAVMTLVIFAIMLTERIGEKTIRQSNRQSPAALAGCAAFFVMLAWAIRHTPWHLRNYIVNTDVSTADLGIALMGKFVFPFEVISVVLIAALVGAVAIAKKEKS